MKSLSFWLHILAQLAVQAVAFNLPEPAGKYVALVAGLLGAVVAWYDKTYAIKQNPS